MINKLIKWLGGYTHDEYWHVRRRMKEAALSIKLLEDKLVKAMRNDYRDPKTGRFVSKDGV